MSSEPANQADTAPRRRMTGAARRAVIETAAAELFAERGYTGASIDEIAARSGVSPPVVYDHFESKQDLYRGIVERHYADLRQIWNEHFVGEDPLGERIARSFDAWFAYIEEHPFAGRMLFRDTVGDSEADAVQAEVAERSRAQVMTLYPAEPGAEELAGSTRAVGLEMAWVVMRGVLQGLAMWWSGHPEVPREQVVAMSMNSLWVGFERVLGGEAWLPDIEEETDER